MKRLFVIFWGVVMSVSSAFAAESFVLENEFVRFEVDSGGKLVSLKNKSSGAEYAGNRDLWRIIYSKADSLENEKYQNLPPTKYRFLTAEFSR